MSKTDFERCTFNHDGLQCHKKAECPICHQCGDGGHGDHCPGHLGVDEYFLKKPGEKKAKKEPASV